jgi:ribonucleoside-diphosphate reductase alpha chain
MTETMIENLIKERYCANENERIGDTWANVCKRVAEYLADSRMESEDYYDMIYKKEFLPNSPTLMNAGTETPMLSACFYLPISDCISNGKDGIFDQVKNAAIIFKFGGGVGLNFSNLRPAGSKVKSTNGVSSGVISFMKNFNTMTETIKQGGKRRGALMGCLDVDHSEIKDFVQCKSIEGDLSNFNISVKLTDDFLTNVEDGIKEENEIFDLIIDGIYKNGEPGLLFKDEIERYNPRPDIGTLNPNPCAEALLTDFESCNLGSINWSCLVNNNNAIDWQDNINWELYDYLIRSAVRFLNKVIDKNKYPLQEVDTASKITRKIGLGGMGFHDMLIRLNIPYDSEKALDVARVMENNLKMIALEESLLRKYNNASLTTIAPTGTISIIANVSSGIEPVFNWVITRKDSLGEHYIVHPIFKQKLKEICSAYDKAGSIGILKSDKTMEEKMYNDVIAHCHKNGTIQDIDWIPDQFKLLFKNAMDINWKQHVKMQATFQTNGVDMSISKTINLPNNATKSDIREAIFMAWKLQCKGLTIYRSGSREHEVLNLKVKEAEKEFEEKIEQIIIPETKNIAFKRPRHLFGATYKVQSGCGKLYVTINERNGKPYEVFIQSGGSGGCEAGNQALGRTISLALRNGGDIHNIIKQLSKVKCPAALRNPRSEGKSCSDIVGRLITESIPDDDEEEDLPTIRGEKLEQCPSCKDYTLVRESGCKVCHSCGYNKCG